MQSDFYDNINAEVCSFCDYYTTNLGYTTNFGGAAKQKPYTCESGELL